MPDLSIARLHRTLMARLIPLNLRASRHAGVEVTRLGTPYGGWWVPLDGLGPESIVYSVGVGEDASFDLELSERTGCRIQAFDPTPRALAYLAGLAAERLDVHPYGIWTEDTTIQMFTPANSSHVSLSVYDRFSTGTAFDLPVRTLTSAMALCGHDRIDLLKMDIEGAEAPVLDALLAGDLRPIILAVEFEKIESVRATMARIRRIQAVGYRAIAVERNNVTFLLPHVNGSLEGHE